MNKIESKVIEKMQDMGGNFVRSLSSAYIAADPENRERIREAFPEIWQSYLRLVLNSEVAG